MRHLSTDTLQLATVPDATGPTFTIAIDDVAGTVEIVRAASQVHLM